MINYQFAFYPIAYITAIGIVYTKEFIDKKREEIKKRQQEKRKREKEEMEKKQLIAKFLREFKWEKMYFKQFKEIRKQNGLQEINNCGLCSKRFEINSSVFFTPKKKVICKECYEKVSKQTERVY